MATEDQQDLARYYQGLANDAKSNAESIAKVEAAGLAESASIQSTLISLRTQRQLAILPADRARLDNSIQVQTTALAKNNSAVTQLQQQRTAALGQVTQNETLAREAVGGPPAARNIPGPAQIPAPPVPPPATVPVTPAATPAPAPTPPPPARVEPRAAPPNDFVTDPETDELIPSDSARAAEIRADQNRVRPQAEAPRDFVTDPETNELIPSDSDRAAEIRAEQEDARINRAIDDPTGVLAAEDQALADAAAAAEQDEINAFSGSALSSPPPVPGNFTAVSDPEGTAPNNWGVWNDNTGVFESTGLNQSEAQIRAENLSLGFDSAPTRPGVAGGTGLTPEEQAAKEQAAAKAAAINQATLNSVYKQGGSSDWRVRLQLAPTSDYLYNANPAGILKPLAATNGVIFPYTPAIDTAYKANYEQYDLVHSNYRGVYYKNSRVDDLNIRATFTAQDTREADYLLAVIHFFRSVTKMFYGKDAQRGSPPPLVFLSGYGMNQFYGHPCVISNFQYNLPDSVDYIRATNVNNYGTDLLNRRSPSRASGTAGLGATGNRILNAGLERFFPANKPTPDTVVGTVNNTQLANYVPTKMEIALTLIPVQTRSQVSKQFSLKGFANGDLIKGGFW